MKQVKPKKAIEKLESIFDTEKRLRSEAMDISKNRNIQNEKIKYLLKY